MTAAALDPICPLDGKLWVPLPSVSGAASVSVGVAFARRMLYSTSSYRSLDRDENADEITRLAREAKYRGENVASRYHLLPWCRMIHAIDPKLDVEAVMSELLPQLTVAFENVTATRYTDTFARAAARADEEWEDFRVWGVEGERARVLALVHWLTVMAPQRISVVVPVERIADWLGCCRQTAGRILVELADVGLIDWKDGGEWRYTGHQARECRFVGLEFGPDVYRKNADSSRNGAKLTPVSSLPPMDWVVGSKCGLPSYDPQDDGLFEQWWASTAREIHFTGPPGTAGAQSP